LIPNFFIMAILHHWSYFHTNFLNAIDRLDITIDIYLEFLLHGFSTPL